MDGIDRDIIKNIHYTQPWRNGNTPFIADAACIKKNKRHYVRLYSTNFGLCRNGCEWSDFFTAQGKYLGSTGGHRGMISFPLRYIGYPLYDHILSGDWIEQADDQSSIHINRVRKYTEE